jgi:hypothetical protein
MQFLATVLGATGALLIPLAAALARLGLFRPCVDCGLRRGGLLGCSGDTSAFERLGLQARGLFGLAPCLGFLGTALGIFLFAALRFFRRLACLFLGL